MADKVRDEVTEWYERSINDVLQYGPTEGEENTFLGTLHQLGYHGKKVLEVHVSLETDTIRFLVDRDEAEGE